MLELVIPALIINAGVDESRILVTYEDPVTGERFTRETSAPR